MKSRRGTSNLVSVALVRAANFLEDSGSNPHMKLTAIDKAFGVAESTGQGKSALIRKMPKIRQFDWQSLLPSQIDT